MKAFLDKYSVKISILLLLLYLFSLNYLLPPQSDDIYITFRDAGLSVLERMKNIYMGWNGRFGELLYVGFINAINDWRFDILNSIIGTIFILLVFFHTFGKLPKDKNDSFMLIFILFCFLYFSSFGSDFLWTAGSLNYLWSGSLILLSFVPYHLFLRNKYYGKDFHLKPIYIPFLFILCVIAGWSSEAMAVVSIVIHIAILGFLFYKKIRIPKWYIIGIVLFIAGFCLLYFSPGTNHRSNGWENTFLTLGELITLPPLKLIDRIQLLLDRAYSLNFIVFYNAILLIFCVKFINKIPKQYAKLLFIIFLGILSLCMNYNVFVAHIITFIVLVLLLKYNKEPLLFALFFIYIIHLLLVLAPIQISYIPPRARLGENMMLIAGLCLIFRNYLEKYVTLLALVISIIYMGFVWNEYYSYHNRLNEMKAYIYKQKALGAKDIVYDNIFVSHYKNFNDWLMPGEIFVESENKIYERLYKLRSFVIKNGDKTTWKF